MKNVKEKDGLLSLDKDGSLILIFFGETTWDVRLQWTVLGQETKYWTVGFEKGSNYLTSRTTSYLGGCDAASPIAQWRGVM
jgi:hypothetical protein